MTRSRFSAALVGLRLLLALLVWAAAIPCSAAAGSSSKAPEPVFHTGMCDASAGIVVQPGFLAVANDEDNILRIYATGKGGPPIKKTDLTEFLRIEPKHIETDLEGAAVLGQTIYWIGSHGRSRDGKLRPNRQRLFATTIAGGTQDPLLLPKGIPCTSLLKDLLLDGRYAPFGLEAASRLAPKMRGALNIEGLSATPEGDLLVGFRNPIPGGKALIAPLLNPAETLEGHPAKFGDPILLELGGLGIRDMVFAEGRYLILAGPFGEQGAFRLYRWDGGKGAPAEIAGALPRDINPEAIVFDPGSRRYILLSDDGMARTRGQSCKLLSDPAARKFRSFWLDLGGGDTKPAPPTGVH